MKNYTFDFYRIEKKLADKPFLLQPFGDKWESWTYKEVGQQARKMAAGLLDLGLPPKSNIGLVSKNCREWIVADLAIVMAGYVSVPFFPTLSGDQIKEVLALGDVKALFVGKMDDWEAMKTGVPESIQIIAMPHYAGNSKVTEGLQWQDILDNYQPIPEVAELNLDDIWTIIFTSGTTGTPKGVVLEYSTFEAASIPTDTTNDLKINLDGDNRLFSYLPLNHIAERVVVETLAFKYGGTVAFSESLESFPKNLAAAKPTLFFGVPRIYTKFQQAILAKMPQNKLNFLLKIPILSGIIKKKLKTALGLQEARAIISGAAPLPEPLKQWWKSIGVEIMNGYGMTENCAISTLLDPKYDKPSSVGKAQPAADIKIDPETNEILMKGPYVMRGYYKNPEKTAEVLKDGWLHTGDQGHLDDEGFLFITGRVKDTFKTAKGKYIIPGPIEWKLAANPNIEQLCITGLGCEQPIALINLSDQAKTLPVDTIKASLEKTRVEANKDLPNYQRVDTIVVVKDTWSPENQLLTPTLKVKRNVVANKYQDQLSAWEAADDSVIFE